VINADVRALVRRRAGDRCEYCLLSQAASALGPLHVEHVIARQHGGSDDPANLALACDRCNFYKGTNLTTVDPESRSVVPLFNPRSDLWSEHFRLEQGWVVGLTVIGRGTVRLLNMNAEGRVQLRTEAETID
jgi:5-methylcytosine-specific restriction endonuclease McrA